MLQKEFATYDNSSLEKQSTDGTSILGSARFHRNIKTIKTNVLMKTKLLSLVTFTALAIGALPISPLAFAQTDVPPTSAPSTPAQTPPTQQMQGMDSNSDSMKQMAEMCMRMMNSEKAAMPYIIAVSVLFGLLLFVALVLLIVLEILWIKYWSRILKSGSHLSERSAAVES